MSCTKIIRKQKNQRKKFTERKNVNFAEMEILVKIGCETENKQKKIIKIKNIIKIGSETENKQKKIIKKDLI